MVRERDIILPEDAMAVGEEREEEKEMNRNEDEGSVDEEEAKYEDNEDELLVYDVHWTELHRQNPFTSSLIG